MCGIAGIVERRGRVDPEDLEAMGRALAHRGPDDAGRWLSPTAASVSRIAASPSST